MRNKLFTILYIFFILTYCKVSISQNYTSDNHDTVKVNGVVILYRERISNLSMHSGNNKAKVIDYIKGSYFIPYNRFMIIQEQCSFKNKLKKNLFKKEQDNLGGIFLLPDNYGDTYTLLDLLYFHDLFIMGSFDKNNIEYPSNSDFSFKTKKWIYKLYSIEATFIMINMKAKDILANIHLIDKENFDYDQIPVYVYQHSKIISNNDW